MLFGIKSKRTKAIDAADASVGEGDGLTRAGDFAGAVRAYTSALSALEPYRGFQDAHNRYAEILQRQSAAQRRAYPQAPPVSEPPKTDPATVLSTLRDRACPESEESIRIIGAGPREERVVLRVPRKQTALDASEVLLSGGTNLFPTAPLPTPQTIESAAYQLYHEAALYINDAAQRLTLVRLVDVTVTDAQTLFMEAHRLLERGEYDSARSSAKRASVLAAEAARLTRARNDELIKRCITEVTEAGIPDSQSLFSPPLSIDDVDSLSSSLIAAFETFDTPDGIPSVILLHRAMDEILLDKAMVGHELSPNPPPKRYYHLELARDYITWTMERRRKKGEIEEEKLAEMERKGRTAIVVMSKESEYMNQDKTPDQ